MIDNAIVTTLYREGKTLREIGETFGVSRQRIDIAIRTLGLSRIKNPKCYEFRNGKYRAYSYIGTNHIVGTKGKRRKTLGNFKTGEEAKQAVARFREEYLKNHPAFSIGTGKIYTRKNPTDSEIWVANKLKTLGFKVEHSVYNKPYDLLVNDRIKIEVKHKTEPVASKYNRYQIPIYNHKRFDFLIAICGELKNNPQVYIVPSEQCTTLFTTSLASFYKTKTKNYLNNWNLSV